MRRWPLILASSTAWSGPAWAEAPDRLSAVLPTGGGDLRALQETESGAVVVGLSGGNVHLLDLERWVVGAPDTQPCTANAVAAHDDVADGTVEVAVGCEDGSIHLYTWNGRAFGNWRGGAGQVVTEFAGRAVRAVLWPWEDQDERLFAVVAAETGTGFNGVTLSRAADGYVVVEQSNPVLLQNGFDASVVNPFGVGGSTQLLVRHGANRWSSWTPVTGALVVSPQLGGINIGVEDMAPRSGGFAWAVTDDGDIATVDPSLSQVVNPVQFDVPGLRSLVEIPDAAGEIVDSYGVFADGELIIQDVVGDIAIEEDAIDAEGERLVDLASPRAGLVIGGTSDGDFAVFTRAPWIGTLELSPDNGVSGTEVSYAFASDGPGAWTVQVGGSRTEQPSGDEVASGSLDGAGDVDGTFTIPAGLPEGENVVWAFVTDPDTGERGYAAASLTIDNAPEQVVLRDSDVGFGNGELLVTLRLLDASDIEAYDIYVSEDPFTADDHPSGGPATTIHGRDYPRVVTPPDGDEETTTVTLSPLDNGTTYYIAIRARDTGGAEGPMSRVVSETPETTRRASTLAGEGGGCQEDSGCNTGGGGLVALGGLLGVFAVRRRRGASLAAGMLGAFALAATPSVAQAQDAQPANPLAAVTDKDITPAWVNVEASYGSFNFADETLATSFGNSAGLFRLEIGAQLFRYVEFDLGLGYMGPKGNTLTNSGRLSAEEQRLKVLPMNMALTARIHVLDEQPLVPYARVGLDMLWYREVLLNSEGGPITSSRLNGSKRGWHWGAGGNILLDLFMPRRASMLEASTGINDTWLFVEYRQQFINPDGPGFDFSGWNVSAGLKLDY